MREIESRLLPEHLGNQIRDGSDGDEALDVRPEVPCTLAPPVQQRVDERQVAVQAVEHVLPRTHGHRIAQGWGLSAGVGVDQVRQEAVRADISAADHVARSCDPGGGPRERMRPRLREEVGHGLGRAVGIVAPQRVSLAVAPDLVLVPVDLVRGDDQRGLHGIDALHAGKHVHRAVHVGGHRRLRIAVGLAHERLGREVHDHVGPFIADHPSE